MDVELKNLVNNPVFSEDEVKIEVSKEEYSQIKYALSLINKYENIAFSFLKKQDSEWKQKTHRLKSLDNGKDVLIINIKQGMIG